MFPLNGLLYGVAHSQRAIDRAVTGQQSALRYAFRGSLDCMLHYFLFVTLQYQLVAAVVSLS